MTFNAFQYNKTSFNRTASSDIIVRATIETEVISKTSQIVEVVFNLNTSAENIPPTQLEKKLELNFEVYSKLIEPVELEILLDRASSQCIGEMTNSELVIEALSNADLLNEVLPEILLDAEFINKLDSQTSFGLDLNNIVLPRLGSLVETNLVMSSDAEIATAGASVLGIDIQANGILKCQVHNDVNIGILLEKVLSISTLRPELSLDVQIVVSKPLSCNIPLILDISILSNLVVRYQATMKGTINKNNPLIDNPYYPGTPDNPFPNYPREPGDPIPVLPPGTPTDPKVPLYPPTTIPNGATKPRTGFVINAYME